MYLIAAVTYEDEFHKTRSSRYCVQYNPSNSERVFCPNNNAVE